MNSLQSKVLALSVVCLGSAQAQVAYTPPLGAEVVSIDAGTPAAPVATPLTLQLADRPAAAGLMRGALTAVSGTTLTVASAGWSDAALAQAEFPYDVLILTGTGAGARLAVTTNTTDSLSVTGRDLAELGVAAGDQYQLLPVDTLDSLFGSDTFLGGTSPTAADVIAIGEQQRSTYYFNTTNSQWQRTDGSATDEGATRLPANGMIAVVRKSGSFSFTLVGAVPISQTNIPVANQGTTFTHIGFPTATSLGSLALNTRLPGWVSHANATQADLLAVAAGGSWVTYFHNGTQWQRTPGSVTARDSVVIPAGTPIRIVRRTGAGGSTPLVLPLPYPL